jgi:hypothetical protein
MKQVFSQMWASLSLSLSLSLCPFIACNFALTFSIVVKEMVSLRKTPDDETLL